MLLQGHNHKRLQTALAVPKRIKAALLAALRCAFKRYAQHYARARGAAFRFAELAERSESLHLIVLYHSRISMHICHREAGSNTIINPIGWESRQRQSDHRKCSIS